MKSINLIKKLLSTMEYPELTKFCLEEQNKDYEGACFSISQSTFRSRLAKLTPKKKGYFLAFWEKNNLNTNQAFSYEKSPDYLIISIIDGDKTGQFIFPKDLLKQQKILRTEAQKGKMAIRVYPSWEFDLNSTASNTQKWQTPYFIDLSQGSDIKKFKELYKKG